MTWTTIVGQDGDDAILELPSDMLKKCGWNEGDEIHAVVEGVSLKLTNVTMLTRNSEEWENGTLGCSEVHVKVAPAEAEARLNAALKNVSLE